MDSPDFVYFGSSWIWWHISSFHYFHWLCLSSMIWVFWNFIIFFLGNICFLLCFFGSPNGWWSCWASVMAGGVVWVVTIPYTQIIGIDNFNYRCASNDAIKMISQLKEQANEMSFKLLMKCHSSLLSPPYWSVMLVHFVGCSYLVLFSLGKFSFYLFFIFYQGHS